MTQEEKELLLKDLSARLPYDVKVNYDGAVYYLNEINPACKDIDYVSVLIQDEERRTIATQTLIEDIKPYLRPMSDMTEEERSEYKNIAPGIVFDDGIHIPNVNQVDWFNKKMFAYRTLDGKDMFELGLAIEAKEGMYET